MGLLNTLQVFLTEFSKMDFSDFCLAHVFTYRDFPAGIQGGNSIEHFWLEFIAKKQLEVQF